MRTGDPVLDRKINELLDSALTDSDGTVRRDNRDLLRDILTNATLLCRDRADRLDLKIAASALAEMRAANEMFRPFRGSRKVTIFGSARTSPDSPLYRQTVAVASRFAAEDWMVVTGAGPGIMAAGLEGAGREHALGAAILLPFESEANEHLDPDRLVDMRYFFTRKLALIRESDGFIVMPGGFGTLDETFELLTLLQTGKAEPVPVVMLGLGQGFWTAWEHFVDTVVEQGYAGASDRSLYRVTNQVDDAVNEILGFYRNHHSIRWVRDDLVIRVHHAPSPEQLRQLQETFGRYCDGPIALTTASRQEITDNDQVDLARIRLRFDRRQPGRLRALIDMVNSFVPKS